MSAYHAGVKSLEREPPWIRFSKPARRVGSPPRIRKECLAQQAVEDWSTREDSHWQIHTINLGEGVRRRPTASRNTIAFEPIASIGGTGVLPGRHVCHHQGRCGTAHTWSPIHRRGNREQADAWWLTRSAAKMRTLKALTRSACLMILATCSSRQAEPRRVRNARWFSAAAIPRKVWPLLRSWRISSSTACSPGSGSTCLPSAQSR